MLKRFGLKLRTSTRSGALSLKSQFRRLGDQARDQFRWVEAAKNYQSYLKLVPTDTAIWTQLGHALKESGDWAGGEAAYRTGLAFAPQDAELHLQLAHVLKLQGRVIESQESYTRASKLDASLGAQSEIISRTAIRPTPELRSNAKIEEMRDTVTSILAPSGSLAGFEDHRVQGDRARDSKAWELAATHYRAYLDETSNDAAIWVQYGHALKESGRIPLAEVAYRTALLLEPDRADTYLQIGHILKIQEKRKDAAEAYRVSLTLSPTAAAIQELRASGHRVNFEDIPLRKQENACTYLEISDLIVTMREYSTISGIQRVQLGLLNYFLHLHNKDEYEIVFWKDGLLWSISWIAFRQLADLYNTVTVVNERRVKVTEALESALPVRPGPFDTFLITGAIWMRDDAMVCHERVKSAGTRLGAYIYDFIPLTNPEFCHPYLTERFSTTMAELMIQLDFAFCISDFVSDELRRLRLQAGYPAISALTVKLAHQIDIVDYEEYWEEKIIDLKGKEFVICVGSLAAHKNHIYVLQLWRLLLERGIEPPILVLAGKRGYGIDDLTAQLQTSSFLNGRVRIVEALDDVALTTLYRSCLFSIFPSFVEGWGLPVGESLAHGKVCFASNTTAIPEAGDGFAFDIDPYNVRAGADAITNVLIDRNELQRLEKIVKSGFKARSWNDFGHAFVQALGRVKSELKKTSSGNSLSLRQREVLRPRPLPTSWSHGSKLPTLDEFRVGALSRSAFISGWFPVEDWGCWMDGAHATITLPIDQTPSSRIRIVIQLRSVFWPRRNRVHLEASGGETAVVSVPIGQSDFLIHLDCRAPEDGRLHLKISLSGPVFSGGGEQRKLGVGLCKLLYCSLDPEIERVPPATLVKPTSLIGVRGSVAVPQGRDSLIEAARRCSTLSEGWKLPEAWGVWMDGPSSRLSFKVSSDFGVQVRVMLRLRCRTPDSGSLIVHVTGGEPCKKHIRSGDINDLIMSAVGQVGQNGVLDVSLSTTTPSLHVGVCAFAWGRLSSWEDRVALLESAHFDASEQPFDDISLLGNDVNFTIAGHMKGSYSLASVNRRLALALDAALPGRVRIDQIEGHPVNDLSGVAHEDRLRLSALTQTKISSAGTSVVISQHWPIWQPRSLQDVSLAYVFWEESVVPQKMVETLNNTFRGVLVPAQSVGKALIDSGVHIPVRCIGFAPDLSKFQKLSSARALHTRAPISQERPFTFLHVSSCFPRKGVDVLIAAFAKAFTSRDPVRLIIKGFPNPHNDVAEQLALLRMTHADLATIELLNEDMCEDALLELYGSADVIVLPTRGEGFNIPAAEALAAGIPLIVTGFGAQTDFTGDGLARWVDYRFTYSDSHLRTSNSVWAEPDITDLVAALQEAALKTRSAVDQSTATLVLGCERAAQLGDGLAWAERVRSTTVELLATPLISPPKIAWISTWNIRCGIAEYSRMLLEKYPDARRDVTVLCDARTTNLPLNSLGPVAQNSWRRIDPSCLDELSEAIANVNASVIVIQHHHALIRWQDLAFLLEDDRVRARRIIVTMHNTQELLDADMETQERLVSALGSIDRVLVHTISDLNLLKSKGLIANVSMFPHGALTSDLPINPTRAISPDEEVRIGAYGFFLPHKGFDRLIEAFEVVRRTYCKAILRLVTAEYPTIESKQEILRCQELSRSLGVGDSIEWYLDYLPTEQSLALLNVCDLLVLPYQHTPESSSAAVRSALAARTPVLVTPLPIFEELQGAVLRLHGTDVQSIASGIEWLIQREDMRRDMTVNSDRWLDENNWSNVAKRLAGMLKGLTADGTY